MPKKGTDESPWRIETKFNLKASPMTKVADGYALPESFVIHAVQGQLRVEVPVEIVDKQARASRLVIETDQPAGLGSAALRQVKVRDIVAQGVINVLMRFELVGTTAKLEPVDHDNLDEDDIDAVLQIVAYLTEVPR